MEKTKNQEELEKLLHRIVALATLMETSDEDIKNLKKLVDMSTSVSAQLLAAERLYKNLENDEADEEIDDEE